MLTFAITTTTKLASISLHEDNKTLGEITIQVAKTHSTTILEQIDSLFSWTGKKLEDVKNVLVSIGPGSFTGVRISIAVVKGLFYEKDINCYIVNELDALAYQAYYQNDINKKSSIYAIIDSGKEKIYYAKYMMTLGENEILQKPVLEKNYSVAKINDIIEEVSDTKNTDENILFIGDGVFNYKNKIKENIGDKIKIFGDNYLKIKSATFMSMFLENKLEKVDIYSLKPDYLEKSQAERDKK